ncbi:hypothetical protein [Aeoliella mucimassa]|uniref:hypothetical protein n=1 Tax=Aeoliella mucimassa TaxID=2527972 RepID=UPI00119FC1B5|nr:hypothetical protein [Aeoliella mucimassa]
MPYLKIARREFRPTLFESGAIRLVVRRSWSVASTAQQRPGSTDTRAEGVLLAADSQIVKDHRTDHVVVH